MSTYIDDYLKRIDEVIDNGPYKDDWKSLRQYRVPAWFRDSKFGIFIHWGIYSVPAWGNEWYPRNMHDRRSEAFSHHREKYGKQKDFGYADFIPGFRAENFDADRWADILAKSGAKYVVPVAEHHDGFQMYDSKISKWNAVNMGPKRDILGELTEAFTKKGLIPCASSHRAEHWFFFEFARECGVDCDDRDSLYWPAMRVNSITSLHTEPEPTKEYLDDWLVRTCELVDSYRPRLLYFDWWIEEPFYKKHLKKFLAYYYNRAREWGEEVVVTYKYDACAFGTAVVDIERGQFGSAMPFPWQTCTSMGRYSWGYTENNVFKDSEELLQDLVDIVSKNGNMLLNIGPKSDGTFTEEETRNLEEMGAWLSANGEAIYGTHCWWHYGEGDAETASGCFRDQEKKIYSPRDIRYTAKDGYVYATALKRSVTGDYDLTLMKAPPEGHTQVFRGVIGSVTRLEDGTECRYEQDRDALHIHTEGSADNSPIVFKIEII